MDIKGFYTKNNIFMAPLAGITDYSFRHICSKLGAGLTYTGMISVNGLYYGSEKTSDLIDIHKDEHDVGIQIFGSDPEIFRTVIPKIEQYNPALIDINMGCPAPKIVKNNEGCALMKDINLASRIIKAVVKSTNIPVTVKFRKGWDEENINAVEFAKMAEDSGASAVTIHGRTRHQFYSGDADWNIIAEIKQTLKIPVVGNGDIFSAQDAKKMFEYTKCDAVMVARGALGNPWIFKDINSFLNSGIDYSASEKEKLDMAIEHLKLMTSEKGQKCAVPEMRKHICWYLKGFKNSSQIRNKINIINDYDDVIELLESLSRQF